MLANHREMRIKVDNFIDYVSNRNINYFYLETVSKFTGLPIALITDYIFQLVEWHELNIKYEVRCMEYDCSGRVVFDLYDQIPFGDYFTDYQGHEILIEKENVVPIFFVSERLKEQAGIQKKKLRLSMKGL